MDVTGRSLVVGLVVLLISLVALSGQVAEGDKAQADLLFQQGMAAYGSSEYSQAIPLFEEALAAYEKASDLAGQAESLHYLGLAYRALGDYGKAGEALERGLDESRVLDGPGLQAVLLKDLGICCFYQGELETAIELTEKALEIYRQLDDSDGVARSLNNLGLCYWSLGDYRKAIEYHEQSLAIERDLGNRTAEARSLSNLGTCYLYLGDYRKAIDLLERALAIFRELVDRKNEAIGLNNQGLCYWSLGDYRKAIDLYEQSLAIKREIGDRAGKAASLNNLGICFHLLSEYGEAIDFFGQALAIFHELGDGKNEAASLDNLGICYWSLGDYGRAIDYYGQSLTMARDAGDRAGEASILNNLGDCYSSLGEYRTAIGRYTECLAVVEMITTTGEYTTGDPESLWRLQDGLGRSHRALGELAPAAAAWREAVTAIEEMRGRVGVAHLASSFMREKYFVYDRLVPTLLDLGAPEEGMQYAERAKARALVDMMETAMISRTDALPSEVQSASNVARELSALEEAGGAFSPGAVGGPGGPFAATADRSGDSLAVERTQAEYDAFLAELERTQPALGDTLSVNAGRLAEYCQDVESKLGEETVALEYFVTDAETILWVITGDGIQTASRIAVSRENLAQAVRSFRDVIQMPSSQAMFDMAPMEQGGALYDLLIAPVEEYLVGAEHLVIIPSDVLFYLPFAALYRCPGCQGRTFLGGQYLVERFTLSYAPSLASLYWPLQHEGNGSYTSVLSVGNPTGDLLAAQAEATTVARLFPDSTLLLREEGTEAKVKQELTAREYDVVHLSTHGLFDPAMPLLSEVVLRAGGGEDGHLYAGEILGLSLSQTELVVMSACQTALPPEISQDVVVGDEIQGLGQALFVAGVPTALLTLWNVNDASTGELMVEFYQSLMSSGHATKAESLAAAQLALLRGDYGLAYRHPYYWAPFVMYGDWR